MITSVKFCLSYGLLNAIKSCLFFFSESLHWCHRRHHDVTYTRGKCHVTCGHNIIYGLEMNTWPMPRYQAYRPGVSIFAQGQILSAGPV